MNMLVTGALGATEKDLNMLRSMGFAVTVHRDERQPVEYPERYEAVICNGLFLYNDISDFSSLKYIQLTSTGLDRVPLDYIRAHAITLHNARDVYSVPMAEFAVGGVLQLYKQSRFFADNQRAHRWEKHRGLLELSGKTVCIVGCGSVGSACAVRFGAFGCRIIGVNRSARDGSVYEAVYPFDALHDTLAQADVVVLAVPLTAETAHLIDARALAAMKPGAVLVNLARGGIVESNALADALKGHLGGAVLDVFEEEPLPETAPFWDMENVILTPHNSFVGEGNHGRMMGTVLENLKKFC